MLWLHHINTILKQSFAKQVAPFWSTNIYSFILCNYVCLFQSAVLFLFSSPGPKVHVNYCHHLASVVGCLSSVNFSHFKLLLRNHLADWNQTLAGMFLGWSSTKLLFFVPVGYSIWLAGPIICSDWLKFQRSSSLKLMN